VTIQPYLFFEGRCEEALGFYQEALGARVEMMMRNRESPEPPPPECMPPGAEDKIMHACFSVDGARVMASDGMSSGKPDFKGFGISLTARDVQDADRKFNALAAGGNVIVPLDRTFFSPRFGMVADRFGVTWMVMAEGGKPA